MAFDIASQEKEVFQFVRRVHLGIIYNRIESEAKREQIIRSQYALIHERGGVILGDFSCGIRNNVEYNF
jgi:hypothetical protein